MDNVSAQNMRTNLRFLFKLSGSIAEASRQLQINRQQLNKYLNGKSLPSLKSLKAICDHYKIDEGDVYLDEREFKGLFDYQRDEITLPASLHEAIQSVMVESNKTNDRMLAMCGKYFIYIRDPRDSTKVLKTLVNIANVDSVFIAKSIEFEKVSHVDRSSSYFHTLDSVVSLIGERIYFFNVDCEGMPNMNLGLMVLYPSYLTKYQVYNGFLLSVSNYGHRKIYSSPVGMEKIGNDKVTVKDVRQCGTFSLDAMVVPEEIDSHLRKNASFV